MTDDIATVWLQPLRPEDLAELEAVLHNEGLAHATLELDQKKFFRAVASPDPVDHAIGYAGLDIHGGVALLSSVVIGQDYRGAGAGSAVVDAVAEHARAQGVKELWLLTTTAPDFFTKRGFEKVERAAAPGPIAATPEFAHLSPTSAICMRKTI